MGTDDGDRIAAEATPRTMGIASRRDAHHPTCSRAKALTQAARNATPQRAR